MDKLKITYTLDFFGISDQGLVRTSNQDIWDCETTLRLFLLADGMGGHKAGEVAALEAVHFIVDYVKQHSKEQGDDLRSFYKRAILQANKWVYEKSKKEKKYEGMGTTLCLLAFHQNDVVIAHVGDSRIYRLRNDSLERLTEDHSLAQELLSFGTASQDEVQLSPFKNVLTRALGTYSSIEPELNIIPYNSNDIYMLCSDGLTNYATDLQIKKILLQNFSLEERAHHLVELAKQQGGGDNITLVLVQSKDG